MAGKRACANRSEQSRMHSGLGFGMRGPLGGHGEYVAVEEFVPARMVGGPGQILIHRHLRLRQRGHASVISVPAANRNKPGVVLPVRIELTTSPLPRGC